MPFPTHCTSIHLIFQGAILCTIFAMASIVNLVTSLPMYKQENLTHVGEASNSTVTDDLQQLGYANLTAEELMNLSPIEYYKVMGASNEVIAHLTGSSSSEGHYRAKRSPTTCPVTYKITVYADRLPSLMKTAICNGPQTTCLSPSGVPSCKEYFMIHRYKLIATGEIRRMKVPVACTCEA